MWAFSRRGICHFFIWDIGKVGFKIAGNGIRYTHGNGNFLVFFLCKRQEYEIIAWSGQIILARSDKTHIRFILRDFGIQTTC